MIVKGISTTATRRHMWTAAAFAQKANFFEFIVDAMIRAHCGPGTIVVDAGAKYGAHTHAMLTAGATVHAFETAPELAAALARWPWATLSVHRVALSDRDGVAPFDVTTDECDGLHLARAQGATETIDTIKVRTLDSYALRPAFVNANQEGKDVPFLRGAWKTLKSARPIVTMAFDWNSAGDSWTVLAELRRIGYQAFDFFGEPVTRFAPDTWYVLLWPEHRLPRSELHRLTTAGSDFLFRNRDWTPYRKFESA